METGLTKAIEIVKAAGATLPAAQYQTLCTLLDALRPDTHEEAVWQLWVVRYFRFRNEVGSPVGKFTPAQAKGLRDVKDHLEQVMPGGPFSGFEYILTNWRSLSPFLQSQIQPYALARYLPEIIMKLNPAGAAKTPQQVADAAREQYRQELAAKLNPPQ